jgi:N-acetylmuramoyl-L-alanine amidase-like protein
VITLLSLSPYTGDHLAPSPNHDARKAPAIEGIVLHATEDGGDETLSLAWLRSPKSRVSCHLLVSRGGRVTRLVGDRQRAWHAGLSKWHGTSDVNSITLGIEIANRNDGEPYTDAQYDRVAEIVAHYCGQGLTLEDVVSHEAIAEGRKTDPLGWDWDRFRAAVLQRLWKAAPLPVPVPVPASPEPTPTVSAIPSSSPNGVAPRVKVQAAALPKSALRSRTLWLNAMMVLAASGMLGTDALDLAHNVGIHLPENITKWALFVIGILNIILRFRTNRPLSCGRATCPDAPPPSGPGKPTIIIEDDRQHARSAAGAGRSGRLNRGVVSAST